MVIKKVKFSINRSLNKHLVLQSLLDLHSKLLLYHYFEMVSVYCICEYSIGIFGRNYLQLQLRSSLSHPIFAFRVLPRTFRDNPVLEFRHI